MQTSKMRAVARRIRKKLGTASGGEPQSELAKHSADLTWLAKHFRTDKWGSHRYTPHYQRHFAAMRNKPVTVFEIGIGGDWKARTAGASLRMWKQYFPKGRIAGLDIDDRSDIAEDRIRIFQGDQSDEVLLRHIVDEIGRPDIIIDDGSHRPEHVRKSFEVLFPLLADNGIYAVEDIQTSYWPEWGGREALDDPTTSMAMLKGLADGLNYEEFVIEPYEPSYTDLHVVALHYYHNLVFIEKGTNQEGTGKRRMLKARYASADEAQK
jgi:hypothetical protein